jgi:tryptophan halogenase
LRSGFGCVKRRIEQVVVVGADAPAWMAAAAIYGSLGASGVKVRVVELPSRLRAADCYSALPALAGFHERIGLREDLLFRVCQAMPCAGQRFAGWSGASLSFIQGYDQSPPASGAALSFSQCWIKGHLSGLRTPFENFSPGAMAARVGRVPLPVEAGELQATYGYNVDAGAYSALLKHWVTRGGVESKAAAIANVEIKGDRIAAIVLADGERLEADLFVDASGPQAVLIGRMPGTELESWREMLPCDRMIVVSAGPLRPYPAFSQISAFRDGWVGLFPLQDRTAVVACYDSCETSDKHVLDSLPFVANMPVGGEAAVSDLAQGIRKRTWVGNCVAVGEAAFSLEPLDAVQLHITHNCVSQLMSVFPVEADDFREAELYDEIIRRVAANLRDFQMSHFKLNRRFDEPLWDRCRDMAVGATLERKLDVFSARGRVPLYDDETFQEHGWESLFIGHGLIPQSYDPRVEVIPEQELIAAVQDRLQSVRALAEAMPAVEQFIAGTAGVGETTSSAHI